LVLGERPASWRDAERTVDKITRRFGTDAVRPAALVPDEHDRLRGPGRPGGPDDND
jgi:DNA polymerase-4